METENGLLSIRMVMNHTIPRDVDSARGEGATTSASDGPAKSTMASAERSERNERAKEVPNGRGAMSESLPRLRRARDAACGRIRRARQSLS